MGMNGFTKAGLVRMNDVLASHVEKGSVSGLVSAVRRHGETHIEALGVKEFGGASPVQPHTIFRIASMTKAVAAVAALILVEECRVRLDDPVDDFLPEMANRKVLKSLESEVDDTVPARRQITLRDLLTFRAGYGMVMARPGTYPIQTAFAEAMGNPGPPKPQSMHTPDEFMRRLGTLPLIHQPGERWLYHTGSDILGVLIERVSGRTLGEFMRERIFEPLGMNDTGFFVPDSKISRLATAYSRNWQSGEVEVYDAGAGGDWSKPGPFSSAGGGLVSTAQDYLAFAQMLMQNGKFASERILSRPSVLLMTTDQLTDAQKSGSSLVEGYFDNNGWGFGVSVITKRTQIAGTVGRYGWDGGLGTSWANDPDENMIGLLLTQQAWTSPDPPKVSKDFWTSAYAAMAD